MKHESKTFIFAKYIAYSFVKALSAITSKPDGPFKSMAARCMILLAIAQLTDA